jgi:hypothetical protein
MARGWESKSVEEQIANSPENPAAQSSNQMTNNAEERRAADQRRAARERKRQSLNLQRESVLSQKTSNPGRRAALEAALAEIDAQIQSLG